MRRKEALSLGSLSIMERVCLLHPRLDGTVLWDHLLQEFLSDTFSPGFHHGELRVYKHTTRPRKEQLIGRYLSIRIEKIEEEKNTSKKKLLHEWKGLLLL